MKLRVLAVLFYIFCGSLQPVAADTVMFMDEAGNIHFASSLSEIPDRYKSQVVKTTHTHTNMKEYKAEQKRKEKEAKLKKKERARAKAKASKKREKKNRKSKRKQDREVRKYKKASGGVASGGVIESEE